MAAHAASAALRSFSARAVLDAGVRVGLGTDVAGGPSPSVLDLCGHAIAASQRLVDEGDPAARIDAATAFWMATAGGAELTGLPVGLLAVGRSFDAVAVALDGLVVDADRDGWDRVCDKLVHLPGRADITGVWVAGRRVVG